MTPKQADAAITAARPITVVTAYGEKITMTLTERNGRTVRVAYDYAGRKRDGAFSLRDLALA